MPSLRGPRSGLPIKKPTEMWATDTLLVKYLHNYVCDWRHVHSQVDAREAGAPADKAKDAQTLPLPMCRNVANGCDERLQEMADKRSRAVRGFPPPDSLSSQSISDALRNVQATFTPTFNRWM